MIVRVLNITLEAYVAYFVVLHNFKFYLRKKYEQRRNLSLGDEDAHFDGGVRNRKCCSTLKIIETTKLKIVVCLAVRNLSFFDL